MSIGAKLGDWRAYFANTQLKKNLKTEWGFEPPNSLWVAYVSASKEPE